MSNTGSTARVRQGPIDLESVIITAELNRRPVRLPDHAAENRALVALAQAMADSPQDILQRLTETAVVLCRAHSAGISLLGEDCKSFHWPAIAGQWAPYLEGGTLRDFGPCGTVLDRDAAQLFSNPERHFTYLAAVTPAIEEALLLPFYVGREAVGTIWVIAHDQSRRFDTEDLRMLTSLGNFAGAAYQTLLSLGATSKAQEWQHTAHVLAGQTGVLEKLATGVPLTEVLSALIRMIEDQADGLLGSILIRQEDRNRFCIGVAPSLPGSYIESLHQAPITPPYFSPCGMAAHRGEAVIAADIATDQRWSKEWRDLVLRHGLRTCASAPIFASDGRVLGSFGLYHRELRESTPNDRRLFETATHLAGIAIDRAQAEDALSRRTAQYETLLSESPLGVYLIDEDFRIREVNPKALPVFGDIPDLIGRDFDEVMHILWPNAYADEIMRLFRHTLETGEPYITPERIEERRDRAVTEYYQWQINRIQFPKGSYGVVCYFRDISAEVQARLAIAESAERLRFMAESMPQKIFTAKPNGEVDYFNGQWTKFTGLSFEQIKDWGWTQFIHPDDVGENVCRWKRSVETGTPFQFEHRFRRKDGAYRWHLSRAHAMRDTEGRIVMWIGSNTDIDDHRRALEERQTLLESEQMAHAEAERLRLEADNARMAAERANAAKSEFLAAMSHELRTPLNAIGGYVDLLTMGLRGPVTAEQKDDLARIKRSEQHLLGLIDEILDLAKIDSGRVRYDLTNVLIDAVVRDCETMIAPQLSAKGVTYQYGGTGPSFRVRADAEKLRQVLLNLLSNAIKFTPTGGEITVECLRQDTGVQLRVRDTGIGISPDKLEIVFERFVQVHRRLNNPSPGVGLGLAISRDLARGMGGDLTAESTLGVGSTFTLTLPEA